MFEVDIGSLFKMRELPNNILLEKRTPLSLLAMRLKYS
jgi:hypothetical protein